MIGNSVQLLRECRSLAFVDGSVTALERLVSSLRRQPVIQDRELATLVVRHRLVRSRLERHRQLCEGAL